MCFIIYSGEEMQTLKEFKIKLEQIINDSEQVFIVPHLGADFDAIASCIGMWLIAKKFDKPSYIILEEDLLKIEAGVKIIASEIKKTIPVISMDKYKQLKNNNDLLITVDVNKKNLICCKDYLEQFKNIIVIDHHKENNQSIDTEYKMIDPSVSSTSEMITELLCLYSIKYSSRIADYLYAGIYLDTNKFQKNYTSKTLKIASKLIEKGANISKVNELFEEDFFSDRRVQELVSKATFFTYTIALSIADDSVIYTKEELAKVADYLLKYKVDAAFAAGFISEELISVSARSKGKVNVGEVMNDLNGGGNTYSAATKLEEKDISIVAKKLIKQLKPNFYEDNLSD